MWSRPAPSELVTAALRLLGYDEADLDPRILPALIHAGAHHLVLALNTRSALAAIRYELEQVLAYAAAARGSPVQAGIAARSAWQRT